MAAQYFAERPRLRVAAHQAVEMELGDLVVGGANAQVASGRRLFNLRLFRFIEQITD